MNNRELMKFLSLRTNADESWQGGIIPMANMLNLPGVEDADEAGIVLWRSTSSELIHAQPILPSEESRLDGFVEAMLEFYEEHKFPFRPARIECNDRKLADGLSDLLRDSGTTVTFTAKMPQWNAVMRDMVKHFGMVGRPAPSLRDVGCSDEQIREFASAAAAFYRARLWDHLDDVDLIKIETPKPLRYLKYAVVLGAAAQSYGLGFYNKAEDHYDLMSQQVDPLGLNLFSLSFDPPGDMQNMDIELWNELDLPLETGEAFPSMVLYSKKEPRRPTPKELDFATVVLRALADTSEEEIDSGRWTKSVELLGKKKKCVLSIPNLLEPPDRAEWIRRGKTPEMRGNERHFKLVQEFIESNGNGMDLDELNAVLEAKFSGPMDEFEYPMDTPADRAESLCQQAIDAFGRRRIQLARQALAEDPTHIEANILLAESTRSTDRRLELFRDAMETAKKKLGSMMAEQVGHFWGITDTRPFMRACHGLAAFRRRGRSASSKKAMRSAFRANRHVVELMQSKAPPLCPDSYSLGSPEEAAVCISELSDAWDETEGYVDWMFREYFIREKEKAKKLRERKRKQRQNTASRKR